MNCPDLILAGASVRSLAESAIRDGLRPFCVDMFGDQDLKLLLATAFGPTAEVRQIRQFGELPLVLKDVPAHVPLVPVGGLENDLDTLTQLRQQRPVLAPSAAALRTLRDPDLLFPALTQCDCHVPHWRTVATIDNGETHHRSDGNGCRWLKKAIHSAGGQNVRFVEAINNPEQSLSADCYLQEFIDGIPMSATFLCRPRNARDRPSTRSNSRHSEAVLLGCALQLSGCPELNARGFQFCGNAGPVSISDVLRKKLQTAGQCVADHSMIVGVFGVDVVVRDGDPYVLEVNPRLTASHELHEFANPELPGHVRQQLTAFEDRAESVRPGSWLPRAAVEGGQWVRLVVYADRDVQLSESRRLRMLEHCHRKGQQRPLGWLADIPAAGCVVPKATPLCSVYLDLKSWPDSHRSWKRLLDSLPSAVFQSPGRLLEQIQENSEILKLP